jgi:hypothetical protein
VPFALRQVEVKDYGRIKNKKTTNETKDKSWSIRSLHYAKVGGIQKAYRVGFFGEKHNTQHSFWSPVVSFFLGPRKPSCRGSEGARKDMLAANVNSIVGSRMCSLYGSGVHVFALRLNPLISRPCSERRQFLGP